MSIVNNISKPYIYNTESDPSLMPSLINNNNIYNNIYIRIPHIKSNFSACIAIDDNYNLIKYSNSYLIDGVSRVDWYENIYKICERMYNNITYIYNNIHDKSNIIQLENKEYVFLISPFHSSNAGHDLCFILSIINNILHSTNFDELTAIISKNMYPLTKYICSLYFKNMLELDDDVIYNINKITIYKPVWLYSNNCLYYSNMILNKLNLTNNNLENTKIVLLKSVYDNTILKHNIYLNDSNIECFKQKGYNVIHPEKYAPEDIINIVYNASDIVTQSSGICYVNRMFCNRNATIHFICSGDSGSDTWYINECKQLVSNVITYSTTESFLNMV